MYQTADHTCNMFVNDEPNNLLSAYPSSIYSNMATLSWGVQVPMSLADKCWPAESHTLYYWHFPSTKWSLNMQYLPRIIVNVHKCDYVNTGWWKYPNWFLIIHLKGLHIPKAPKLYCHHASVDWVGCFRCRIVCVWTTVLTNQVPLVGTQPQLPPLVGPEDKDLSNLIIHVLPLP